MSSEVPSTGRLVTIGRAPPASRVRPSRRLATWWRDGRLPIALLRQAFYEHVRLRGRGIRFRSREAKSVRGRLRSHEPSRVRRHQRSPALGQLARDPPQPPRSPARGTPRRAIDLCCGGTSGADLVAIFVRLGFAVLGRARSCVFDRYWQHCFCAEAGPTS